MLESTLRSTFDRRDVTDEERIRAVVRLARDTYGLGPVMIYVRDWRQQLVASSISSDFRLWSMEGVWCRSPMCGLVQPRDYKWLTGGDALVTTESEHAEQHGDPGFWTRERITSYAKFGLNGGSDYVVFYRSERQRNQRVLEEPDHNALRPIARALEILLGRLRERGPNKRDRIRFAEFTKLMHRLNQVVPRASGPDADSKMLAEILHTVHNLFAGRDVVWTSVYSMERTVDHPDTSVRFVLKREDSTGVSSRMQEQLNVSPSRMLPVREKPNQDEGVAPWVAYHEVPLLIEDLESHESAREELNLREWYRAVWFGARSEVVIPIKDPSGARLYGVLNLESRTPGFFSGEDVYYLEQLARQAGAILGEVKARSIVEKLHEFQADPDVQLAQLIRRFFMADAAEIYARDILDPNAHPRQLDAAIPTVGIDGATTITDQAVRKDGWTRYLLASKDVKQAACRRFDVDSSEPAVDATSPWLSASDGERKYWYRVWEYDEKAEIESECWRYISDPIHSVNPIVVERGYASQLAIPLYQKVERATISLGDSEQGGNKSIPDLHTIGVLWISWQEWKRPPYSRHVRPSDNEMRVILRVARALAPIIHAQLVREHAYVAGFSHDWKSDLWQWGVQHAERLNSPGLKLLIDFAQTLPHIYKLSPTTRRDTPVIRQSNDRSVRELMVAAATFVTGDYSNFDNGTWRTTDKTVRVKGWQLGFEGVESDAFANEMHFFRALAIVTNLMKNTLHIIGDEAGPAALAWRGDLNSLSGGEPRMASLRHNLARVCRSTSPEQLGFAVANAVPIDQWADIRSKMVESLIARTKGIALVRNAIEKRYGAKFEIDENIMLLGDQRTSNGKQVRDLVCWFQLKCSVQAASSDEERNDAS